MLHLLLTQLYTFDLKFLLDANSIKKKENFNHLVPWLSLAIIYYYLQILLDSKKKNKSQSLLTLSSLFVSFKRSSIGQTLKREVYCKQHLFFWYLELSSKPNWVFSWNDALWKLHIFESTRTMCEVSLIKTGISSEMQAIGLTRMGHGHSPLSWTWPSYYTRS